MIKELDELSKGDRKLALKLADGFLKTYLKGVRKIAEQYKEEM